MEALARAIPELVARQAPGADDSAQEFLKLLRNPFNTLLQTKSLVYSLGTSIGFTAGIALTFSLLRPYNGVVYAPKLKHADEAHAPPPLGKGIFAWVVPLWKTDEKDLVRLVGLDAALFMRFTRMLRNLFFILAVVGCAVLIPINMSKSTDEDWIMKITPRATGFGAGAFNQWHTVGFAYFYTLTVCGFLWWNYKKVLDLRRIYFLSDEYQNSLHARTLMMYDIPKDKASDEGIARVIDSIAPNSSFSRTAVARNVKILPDLIAQHEKTVRKLEEVLAKYLKDPKNLPPKRPQCKPSKKDRSYNTYPRGQKLDAIDYLTQRIKDLEVEIKEVRASVDKRNSMTYGFASYSDISETHAIAFAARNKHPMGTTIKLAPRPNDIIWDNMPLTKATRKRRRFMITLWIILLTILWIGPNACIAMFLVNLSNLGQVWPAFGQNLRANQEFWQLVQGVANPAITSLIYMALPVIFRRLSMRAGDQTKTGRERHVTAKLYSFFVFNNLIVFCLFSALWGFVSNVVEQTSKGRDAFRVIIQEEVATSFMTSLCTISPFWITYILNRQLGAAIDLAQLWPLAWSFIRRKFFNPTPRELIELTAPPPFDYASYYNFFLFYATVAISFAPIQPLIIPAVALYFAVDVALRKYILMYIFVTKTESGGMFWRVLFNRVLFATFLSHLVVFLITWVRGDVFKRYDSMALGPLPVILIIFKIYCANAFDTKIHYYSTRVIASPDNENGMAVGKESHRNDRLAARFGHPALYKPLITPMVHAKAQNILASVYQGRLSDGREAGSGDTMSVSGYSDTYRLDAMQAGKPGKSMAAMPGFELVPESKLDFEYYKNRDEFAEDHGGGEIYNTRPGTPSLHSGGPDSRPSTPVGGMTGRRQFSAAQPMRPEPTSRSASAGPAAYAPYNAQSGYNSPGSQYPGQQSPYGMSSPQGAYGQPPQQAAYGDMSRTRSPLYGMGTAANDSGSNLVGHAAGMPLSPPPGTAARGYAAGNQTPSTPGSELGGGGHAPGMLGGGPQGYGNLPQEDTQDPMTYDYFRGGNSSRRR